MAYRSLRRGRRAVADRIWPAVRRRFEIDRRALAAFRISLGVLLIADLLLRARNLTAFYTDEGVLPREALFSDYLEVYSIHAMSGEVWVQAALFLLAGAVAVALLVGYRTRIATVVSWLLLFSLHARNPMVLNGGDILFRMLLFWAMFLPLGSRWSVDAIRGEREKRSVAVASVGTVALLLQIVLLYATNAIHKLGGEQWLGGEAVIYVFSLDQFTVLFGNLIAEYYVLLRVLTYAWIALVVLSPLLVVLTGTGRAVLASLIAGMHLGMALTMQLGLFPVIVVAGLLPFYPSSVWDAVERGAHRSGLTARLRPWRERLARDEGDSGAVDRSESDTDGTRPSLADRLARGRAALVQGVALFFLVLVVLSNAQAVDVATVPDEGSEVLELTETDQSWQMFAPDPLSTDGWYVVPGNLTDGSTADVLHGGAVDWDRPPNVDATYPTARWRKYLVNVWSSPNHNHRSYFAHYLCGHWNETHETNVTRIDVYYMAQHSQPYNETEPIERQHLHSHDCSGGLHQ